MRASRAVEALTAEREARAQRAAAMLADAQRRDRRRARMSTIILVLQLLNAGLALAILARGR